MAIRIKCKVCRKMKKAGQQVSEADCQKHKERRYEAVACVPGGKQLTKTFDTKTEADIWLGEKKKEVFTGTYRKIQDILFEDFADKCLDSKTDLRPATVSLYKYIVRCYLKPILSGHKMNNIDSDLIDEVVKKASSMSFSLRQQVNTHLKFIFARALAKDIIVRDPTGHLTVLKRKVKVEYFILDNKQIKRLLNLPSEILPAIIRLYYKMSIYLGIRPEELCGLPIHNINFERAEIRINQVLYWLKDEDQRLMHPGKQYIIQDPKSPASFRTVPIGKDLLKDLQIYMIEGYKENKLKLLFTTQDNTPFNYSNIRKRYWYNHRELASLPPLDLYDLRHTYCSILANEGTELLKIKELMGHEDITTTSGIYIHVMKKDNSKVAAAFEKYIDSEEVPYSCHTHDTDKSGQN